MPRRIAPESEVRYLGAQPSQPLVFNEWVIRDRLRFAAVNPGYPAPRDVAGNTPLHFLVNHWDHSLLLRCCHVWPHALVAVNNEGLTPEQLASRSRQWSAEEALRTLRTGAVAREQAQLAPQPAPLGTRLRRFLCMG